MQNKASTKNPMRKACQNLGVLYDSDPTTKNKQSPIHENKK